MPMGAKHADKKRRPAPQRERRRGNPRTAEFEYEAEEVEFIMAMDRYKREKKKPFPTWSEVLEVLRGLGWKKVKEKT
jgi:hypothetical protein